jgi:hypothetical protein
LGTPSFPTGLGIPAAPSSNFSQSSVSHAEDSPHELSFDQGQRMINRDFQSIRFDIGKNLPEVSVLDVAAATEKRAAH